MKAAQEILAKFVTKHPTYGCDVAKEIAVHGPSHENRFHTEEALLDVCRWLRQCLYYSVVVGDMERLECPLCGSWGAIIDDAITYYYGFIDIDEDFEEADDTSLTICCPHCSIMWES